MIPLISTLRIIRNSTFKNNTCTILLSHFSLAYIPAQGRGEVGLHTTLPRPYCGVTLGMLLYIKI